MDISTRRAPQGGAKILTRKDFEAQQAALQKKTQAQAKKAQKSSKERTPEANERIRKRTKRGKKAKDPKGIKAIVRLLPPNLKAEDFWKLTHDYSNASLVFDKYYVQGHYPTKPFKQPVYSRAYISFKTPQNAEQFSQAFRSYAFEDDKESQVPSITASLFPKMIDSQEPLKMPESRLEDLPAFKLFLKVQAGELEKPPTYIVNEEQVKKQLIKQSKADAAVDKAKNKNEKPNQKKDKKTKKEKGGSSTSSSKSPSPAPGSKQGQNSDKKVKKDNTQKKIDKPAGGKSEEKPKNKSDSKPKKDNVNKKKMIDDKPRQSSGGSTPRASPGPGATATQTEQKKKRTRKPTEKSSTTGKTPKSSASPSPAASSPSTSGTSTPKPKPQKKLMKKETTSGEKQEKKDKPRMLLK